MTFNREMTILLSLSGCPPLTTAGQTSLVCLRGATARTGSERGDPQPQAATSGVRSAGVEIGRQAFRKRSPRGTRPRLKGLPNRPPRRFQGCPKPRGPWQGSRPQLRPRRSGPLSGPGQPGMGPVQRLEVALGFPSVEAQKATRVLHHRNPAATRPTGGSLASSPARTWLLAPRLPCPARSPRAGRRPGSCCGPDCSTPPPWGCGTGSCRSRLGRRRRLQAGGLNCSPPPET